ncbi:hypothetical protein J6590_019907 [Homalodisca vitripennis]|nr:hypothetical protein J6590_019907 [Homalodisca vitripennis]
MYSLQATDGYKAMSVIFMVTDLDSTKSAISMTTRRRVVCKGVAHDRTAREKEKMRERKYFSFSLRVYIVPISPTEIRPPAGSPPLPHPQQ